MSKIDEDIIEVMEKYFPKGDKRRGDALVVVALAIVESKNDKEKELLEKEKEFLENLLFWKKERCNACIGSESQIRDRINATNKRLQELSEGQK